MLRIAGIVAAAVILTGAAVPLDTPPVEPAAAIALADSAPRGEALGVFRMRVAAVGKSRKVTFLNSNADYRSEGNVTFSLSEASARALTTKAGVSTAQALVGHTVTVAGRIEKRQIVNVSADGRMTRHNRWGYSVRIDKPGQIVSISMN